MTNIKLIKWNNVCKICVQEMLNMIGMIISNHVFFSEYCFYIKLLSLDMDIHMRQSFFDQAC